VHRTDPGTLAVEGDPIAFPEGEVPRSRGAGATWVGTGIGNRAGVIDPP
jgi:hypothetical protein